MIARKITSIRAGLALALAMGVFIIPATAGPSLPRCPEDQSLLWSNCFGNYTNTLGDTYTGEFLDNKFDGSGSLKLHSGDVYDGVFKGDRLSGRFQVRYANGDRFEGFYLNDKRNGDGTYRWVDGASYTGIWLDGLPTGQGHLTTKQGAEIIGAEFHSKAKYFEDGALLAADVLIYRH